jgi:hypothetical protein
MGADSMLNVFGTLCAGWLDLCGLGLGLGLGFRFWLVFDVVTFVTGFRLLASCSLLDRGLGSDLAVTICIDLNLFCNLRLLDYAPLGFR